jgi:hypothetical protein
LTDDDDADSNAHDEDADAHDDRGQMMQNGFVCFAKERMEMKREEEWGCQLVQYTCSGLASPL